MYDNLSALEADPFRSWVITFKVISRCNQVIAGLIEPTSNLNGRVMILHPTRQMNYSFTHTDTYIIPSLFLLDRSLQEQILTVNLLIR